MTPSWLGWLAVSGAGPPMGISEPVYFDLWGR
jgi:hypothetical protein